MSDQREYGGVTPADLEDLHNVDHSQDVQVGDLLQVTAVDGDGRVHWEAATAGASGTSVAIKWGHITFDDPDILTGVTLYTPTAGEMLVDVLSPVVLTGFDGTNYIFDLGTAATFATNDAGWFNTQGGSACSCDPSGENSAAAAFGALTPYLASPLQCYALSIAGAIGNRAGLPAVIPSNAPIIGVVSADGNIGSGPADSTAGELWVPILIAAAPA